MYLFFFPFSPPSFSFFSFNRWAFLGNGSALNAEVLQNESNSITKVHVFHKEYNGSDKSHRSQFEYSRDQLQSLHRTDCVITLNVPNRILSYYMHALESELCRYVSRIEIVQLYEWNLHEIEEIDMEFNIGEEEYCCIQLHRSHTAEIVDNW